MKGLCQYGNCEETECIVSVNAPTLNMRVRFCSFAHLAKWAAEWSRRKSEEVSE
jgi:hypothetical protein